MIEEFYDPDARPAESIQVPQRPGLPHVQQRSRWSCMAAAFTMVLSKDEHGKAGILLLDIMEQLGRDDERGFHVQEFLGIAVSLGVTFTPFEFSPLVERAPCSTCRTGRPDIREHEFESRLREECQACRGTGLQAPAPLVIWRAEDVMKQYDGVLLGKRRGATHHHAVAWCRTTKICLDPEEGTYGIEGFDPETFWAAFKVEGE